MIPEKQAQEMSERDLFILNWLGLKQNDQQQAEVFKPIINDASQRKYYRCYLAGQSYIVMDSKADPSLPQFITIAKQLLLWGLRVPEIYKVEEQQGLILMSDLGNDLYLQKLNISTANELYATALDSLLIMQTNTSSHSLSLPSMDLGYIKNQLGVFQLWFLKHHLNLSGTVEIQQLMDYLENLFVATFAVQPQVLVHLDYHSRNLLVLPEPKPGILDFQDAMIGPLTYDLVSLLQDAYISWPRAQVEAWLLQYQSLAFTAGLIEFKDHAQFIKLFDLVGLQRHIKNLGVFARLHHRDGKSKYLQDMPMLLQYILATCRRYQELQQLLAFFEEIIMPHFAREVLLCKQ